jgi:hypothetical protein
VLNFDEAGVERGPRSKAGMSTKQHVFMAFDPPTNTFKPLMTILEAVDMPEEATGRTKSLMEIAEEKNGGKSEGIASLAAAIKDFRKEVASLKAAMSDLTAEVHTIRYAQKDLQRDVERYTKAQEQWMEKREIAGKKAIDDKIKELSDKFDKPATAYEGAYLEYKSGSAEWFLNPGAAIRNIGSGLTEKQILPYRLCHRCCKPTEELNAPEEGLVKLTYRAILEKSEHSGYGGSGDHLPHEYYVLLPVNHEHSLEPVSRTWVIPIELWLKCKAIKHDDWHNIYMNRNIEGDEDTTEKLWSLIEKVIREKCDTPTVMHLTRKSHIVGVAKLAFFNSDQEPFKTIFFKDIVSNQDKCKECLEWLVKNEFMCKVGDEPAKWSWSYEKVK